MKNRQKLFLLAATLLLLAGGGWFLYSSGFFQAVRSLDALRDYIDRSAPYSHLLFFLVQFLSVVLAPIPSNITAAACPLGRWRPGRCSPSLWPGRWAGTSPTGW